MRKALSAIRHWPKPPAVKSMNDFFTFQIQTLSFFAFFPPPKKQTNIILLSSAIG